MTEDDDDPAAVGDCAVCGLRDVRLVWLRATPAPARCCADFLACFAAFDAHLPAVRRIVAETGSTDPAAVAAHPAWEWSPDVIPRAVDRMQREDQWLP